MLERKSQQVLIEDLEDLVYFLKICNGVVEHKRISPCLKCLDDKLEDIIRKCKREREWITSDDF